MLPNACGGSILHWQCWNADTLKVSALADDDSAACCDAAITACHAQVSDTAFTHGYWRNCRTEHLTVVDVQYFQVATQGCKAQMLAVGYLLAHRKDEQQTKQNLTYCKRNVTVEVKALGLWSCVLRSR